MSKSGVIKQAYENPARGGKTNVKLVLRDGDTLYVNDAKVSDYPVGATVTYNEDKPVGKGMLVKVLKVEEQKADATNSDPRAEPAPGAKPGVVDQQSHPCMVRRHAQQVSLELTKLAVSSGALPLPAAVNKKVGAIEAYFFALSDKLYAHALGIKADTAAPVSANDADDGLPTD
jgi:hypothetical protein